MAQKTYLELVNRVIDECKITLDPLTSANFANPPRTDMYARVKRWVNDALEELLTTRNEWFSRVERANVYVYPRVHLSNLLVPPMVGYVYQGLDSGVSFVVQELNPSEYVEPGTSANEMTVSVLFNDDRTINDLAVGETLNIISPAPTFNAAIVKANGFYDFTQLVPTMEIVDDTSMILYDPPEDTDPDDERVTEWRVIPVSWWEVNRLVHIRDFDRVSGIRSVARTPLGSYSFFPPLDRKYLLAFNYTRKITPLVNYNDTPVDVPEKYQLYLVWRACVSFADFTDNQRIFSRAEKEATKFLLWMERDLSPKVTIGSRLFYVR